VPVLEHRERHAGGGSGALDAGQHAVLAGLDDLDARRREPRQVCRERRVELGVVVVVQRQIAHAPAVRAERIPTVAHRG
jgi:hypothetical protein